MTEAVPGARVTVRSDVVFQRDQDRSTKCWGEPHSFPVASDEAAWERVMTVGEDWKPLEMGWVEAPSLLLLRNLPEQFQRNPTPERKAEADAKVVEIEFGQSSPRALPPESPAAILRPGRDMSLEPVSKVWARCRAGVAKVLIVSIPR